MAGKKGFVEHILFLISITIKGIDGVIETISGILLLVIPIYIRDIINRFYTISTGTELFVAIYLLIHGMIKIGLVTALFMKKLWAYPIAGIIIGGFVVYQIYRITFTHSILLIILTIIDITILVLMRGEYKRIKKTMKLVSAKRL